MFRQILIDPAHQKYQCILWREAPKCPIHVFELNTVTYGMVSSPYLAIRVMRQLAHDEKDNFPLAVSVLLEQTYVDDVFLGGSDKTSTLKVRDQVINMTNAGGFPLRKWFSNSPDLLDGLDSADHGLAVEIPFDDSSGFKVLGIFWKPSDDAFHFKTFEIPEEPATKRSILSATAKIFDPMGWISPVTIIAKILLQKLWLRKLDWDDSLSSDLLKDWNQFRSSLSALSNLSVPRWTHNSSDAVSIQIHGCVECRIFCSHSTIVLSWLQKQPTSWTTFVANRVSGILTELPAATWNHVPSKQNPADCASRGLSAEDLSTFSLWSEGPTWLLDSPETWPRRNCGLETTEESRIVSHLIYNNLEPDWQSQLMSHYSSCAHLLLTATEINNAALFWVEYVQENSFAHEIQCLKEGKPIPPSSRIQKFSPFLDDNDILPNHPISFLILTQLHKNLLHGGVQLTLYIARTQYWIIGARNLIKGIIRKCVTCVRDKARVENQLMGDLPSARVSPSRPFSHTEIDYAGPFLVRSSSGRGTKSHKAWIAVFVCFSVKAIHLELVDDYTSAAFLAALRRFTLRRGLPTDLYSDNGTNFRGADRELSHTFKLIMKDPTIASYMASDGITWHFMPPSAPHFGGLWEAGVKNVKFHLRTLLSNATPTSEELTTLLCQIECCLNSRPIVQLNEDPESCEALTPGHFLIGSALKTVPAISVLDLPENHLSRWQFYKRVLEQFWRSWSKDYLQSLQQRTKWLSERVNLKINDVVLLRNPNLPPAKWELGRVIKCIPGQDGHVRVVQVKT
ncbi:uncharacterized protein LOC127291122, partial [Leptopilina boulardi]